MKVLIADIVAKVEKLSPGYEKLVTWDGKSNTATAQSVNAPMDGGDPKVYALSIKPWKNPDETIDPDNLDVVCECPASGLCYHLAMFYGVVKKIGLMDTKTAQDPPASTESTATAVESNEASKPPGSRVQALQLISEGIEKLVDGIGQLARSTAREEAKVIVAEILREKKDTV